MNPKSLSLVSVLLSLSFLASFAFAQDKPWDLLRPATDLAHQFAEPITWINFLLALGILAIAIFAYQKNRSQRLAFVSLAFFFFALKWGLVLADIYLSPGSFLGAASQNVFELFIFLFLALALFKR